MKKTMERIASLALALLLLLALLPGSVFAAASHFNSAIAAEPGDIASVTVTPSAGGKISLSWSASANAKTYVLQRHERGGSTWTTLASNVKGTTYVDATGTAGRIYQYRVRGRDGESFGPYKTSAEVACMSGSEPGSVGTPAVKPASGGKITVSWQAAEGAASYILQRSERGSSAWVTLGSNLRETGYTDTSAKAGKVYRYRVRSRNVSVFGPFKVSVEAAAMKGSAPGAVSNVTVTAAAKKITVSWGAAEGAAGYIVQRRERGSDTWTTLNSNIKETSCADTAGEVGAVYQYRVRSRNVSAYGPFKASAEVAFMSGSTPGDIETVTAKAESGKITVTWTASSGAAGYIVQRKAKGASAWENLSTNVTGLTYIDPSAEAGTTYQYRIRPRNGNIYGNFKAGAEVTAVPEKSAPLNEENLLALMDAYDPDGAWIIRSAEGTGISWSDWLLGASTIGDIGGRLGTAVHEQLHGYTSTAGWRSEYIYIGGGQSILVNYTRVFDTAEMADQIPAGLQSYRYDTYVSSQASVYMASRQFGVYGLLDEYAAYCWGMNNDLKMEAYFGSNPNSYSNTYVAFAEFRYYILSYMLYAKEHYSDVYQGILENTALLRAFSSIDARFEQLAEQYRAARPGISRSSFDSEYQALTAAVSAPEYQEMLRLMYP